MTTDIPVDPIDETAFTSTPSRRQFGRMAAGIFGTLALGNSQHAFAAGDETLICAHPAIGPSRHPWQQAGGPVDYTLCFMFFDSLLSYDIDGRIIPRLAESYEVRSLERVRLKIRQGVRFHDGRPFGVEDVKYSLEQTLSPEATFQASYYKRWLDRVEIIDNQTVETVAKTPYRVVPELMAYSSFLMPVGTEFKNYTKPIGVGPYRFVEFVPNGRVVAERNEDYWGAKPQFKSIVIRQIPQNATRLSALAAGEVDFAENIGVEDIDIVKKSGREVAFVDGNRLLNIGFNRTAEGPFQDLRVRQAVHYAIDKAAIRESIYGGMALPAEGPYSPKIPYYKPDLLRYEYNRDKAKALLAQAGFPKGFETTFVTTNNRYLKDLEVAQVVAGMLQDVGIKANLHVSDFITYQQELREDRDNKTGKYGMFLSGWGTPYSDPDPAFGSWEVGSRWNFAGFNSPRMMELLAKGRVTLDKDEVRKIYGEIQEILWQTEAQCLGICFLPYIVGVSKKLSGIKLRSDEIQHWT